MRFLNLAGKNNTLQFIIDDVDCMEISKTKWYLHTSGYVRGYIKKRGHIYLHQFILGKSPIGYEIDHIDRNKLNNTRTNLRVITIAENRQNKNPYKPYKIRKPSRRFLPKGVYFDPKKNRYHTTIKIKGRTIHLGRHLDIESAANAFRQYVKKNGLNR